MKTIYYVNGTPVSLSHYILTQYKNIWSELRRYSLEKSIKKHPIIIQEACNLPDINSAMDYVVSEWKKSKEYDDFIKAYSNSSPDKDAKQYAGCMSVFGVVITVVCIIGIACGID